jgi:hypothetical protein
MDQKKSGMDTIPRGFRRLSVAVALLGVTVVFVLFIIDGGNWSAANFILVVALFAGLPTIFVLLLGWVVAGFRKES